MQCKQPVRSAAISSCFFLIIFVTMHGWNYLIPSKETSVGGGQQKLAAAYQTYKQVITVDS